MSLSRLSTLFGNTPLYIVGGAVRNMLLGVEPKDIDITAGMRAEDVIALLDGTEFSVVPSSLRMGTLIIKDGGDSYEYTCFRTDSYPAGSGVHTPVDVKFTDDIELDARRRDFTVNAIYYDIDSGTYVDPLNGIGDLRARVLRTTRTPREVFSEDGLRLMRLVRFSSELGFDIDEECYRVACSLVHLLRDISVERIEEELSKILLADVSGYGNTNGHYDGINMLINIGAMEYIMPELMRGAGVAQNSRYHSDDVLTHEVEAMRIADTDMRLVALLHDIGKPYELERTGNMHMHNVSGSRIVRDVLTRLRYPNKVIERASRLVYIHMFDIDNGAREDTIKRFILDNVDYIHDFLRLRYADIMSSSKDLSSYDHIKAVYEDMLRRGVPMRLRELAISGDDLKALGVRGKAIGEMLGVILRDVALDRVANDRDAIVAHIRGGEWRL